MSIGTSELFSRGLALADLDSDADFDVLVLETNEVLTSRMLWYENTNASPPLFIEHVVATLDGTMGQGEWDDVATTDLDDDGDFDFVALGGDQIVLFQNDGSTPQTFPQVILPYSPVALISSQRPADLAFADIDGDSWTDVVVGFINSQRILWFKNLGLSGGSFAEGCIADWATSPLPLAVRHVTTADLDLDGDIDVASATRQAGTVYWHENNGSGAAQCASSISPGFIAHELIGETMPFLNDPGVLFAADLDSDGDGDLVVSWVNGPQSLQWIENTLSGFPVRSIRTPEAKVYGAICIDSDADGDQDILGCLPEFSTQGLALYRQNAEFRRADANSDGVVNIADPIAILGYLFSAAPLTCLEAANANDDPGIDIADAVFALSFLFSGGPSPPAPFPGCGLDPIQGACCHENGGACP